MDSFVSWWTSAIIYGTIIMFGALGEILTEKGGHLNLGVPGLMFLGGFAGFTSAFLYEQNNPNPNAIILLILPIVSSFVAAGLGGLLYSFFTITLRANQNVTGLALTFLGVGLGSFGGSFILLKNGFSSFAKAAQTSEVYLTNINTMLDLGSVGKMFLSYSFMTYLAIILAVGMHFFLKKTRVGLNLRAVGENPATADAAGINVTRYKYLSTSLGGGVCGLGGLFYVMVFNSGGWSTNNNIEALGWLAVALVIFATWKPLNTIWGSYLFAMLYWLYTFLPNMIHANFTTSVTDLIKALPYLFTIIMLIITAFRKKRENQPPASLGVNYYREER